MKTPFGPGLKSQQHRELKMPPGIFSALLLVFFLAPPVLAQSTALDSTSTPLPRPRYRSLPEEAIAVPGMALYIIAERSVFSLGKYLAYAIWNLRLLDRAKALSTTADGRAGVRPLSSTHIGTGARLFYKNLFLNGDATLISSWGSSTTKSQRHKFQLYWPSGRILPGGLKFTADYYQRPKSNFYGMGSLSKLIDLVYFHRESLYLRLNYRRRLSPQLVLNAGLNYHYIDIRRNSSRPPGPLPASLLPPGLATLAQYVETSATLNASFVDVPNSPTHGHRTLLYLGYTQSVDDNALSHLKLLFITEQFRELFYRRTLSLRLGTEWRLAPGANEVPFYELSSLGGTEYLRGYETGRFRDRGSAFAKVSYKYPIWKLLEGMLFYETGRTLRHPGDLNRKHWKSAYGGGLRFWVPEGFAFEQSVAISDEETRLHFDLSTLF